MSEIIPAILEKNFSEIKNKLTALRGVAKCVHIDICDGVFAPSQTWPFSGGGWEDPNFQKIMNEEEGMPFCEEFDFLHCMGSDKIGCQGEAFSNRALENIKLLKKDLPGVVISVDIGINLENAESILGAGADRLTVGSGIWKSGDPLGALQSFQSLAP